MSENNSYTSEADMFGGTRTKAVYFKIPKLTKEENGSLNCNIVSGPKGNQCEYDYISGYLVDIKIRTGEYEGQATKHIELTLLPPTGEVEPRAVLTCGFNSWFARDLLNRLSNVDDFSKLLVISTYISTDPEKQKAYVRCSLKYDSIRSSAIKGLYEPDKIPKAKMVYIKELNQEMLVDVERNEFFENLFKSLSERLKSSNDLAIDQPVYSDEDDMEETMDLPQTQTPPVQQTTQQRNPPTQQRTTQAQRNTRPEPMEPVMGNYDYDGRQPF